ncbi:tripartite tricarboxylate transporter substrate binding protein [Variovorax rhizosphaerae]|uniref:Tripartite tricarboxylate transporter substrate binding protein n=1 Tax=Variovorax rhizosphaerae TaxID=1836200 RepID=A0ABU8WMB5_9BURK
MNSPDRNTPQPRGLSRRQLVTAVAASALTGFAGSASAATFPDRALKVILMFPPGGGSDSQARLVSEKLSGLLGQPVVVENRPGGGGTIAANAVKSLPADGYTLLHSAIDLMTLTPAFNAAATYSPQDFLPLASIATAPPLLIARSEFPANNVAELVALAKKKPGALSYGTWGPGSVPHVAGEWLQQQTGIQLTSIPYKGEVPLIQDMLGDQLPLGWATLPALLPHLKAGKFKVLGVAAARREPLLPNVPTFIEQGMPDFAISGWMGLFVRKGTPPELVTLLNAKINEVLKMPDVQERIKGVGQTPVISTSAQFGEIVAKDATRLKPTLEALAPAIRN